MELGELLRGKIVMFDGPDKAGKGTAAKAICDHLSKIGLSIFDITKYQKEYGKLPTPQLFLSTQGVVSAEPTYCWSGLDLRDEHLRNGNAGYEAEETAELFSANRCTLYRRCLLPALAKGMFWIQERGVVTSLVYQPVQAMMNGKKLSREYVENLAGNKLALANPPHILIIVNCNPEVAVLRKRVEKEDDSYFEQIDYMRKLNLGYKEPWVKDYFEELGSKVCYIDTTHYNEEDTRQKTLETLLLALK